VSQPARLGRGQSLKDYVLPSFNKWRLFCQEEDLPSNLDSYSILFSGSDAWKLQFKLQNLINVELHHYLWGADRATVSQNVFKLESCFNCQGRKRFQSWRSFWTLKVNQGCVPQHRPFRRFQDWISIPLANVKTIWKLKVNLIGRLQTISKLYVDLNVN
jgi:hypothetical protein